MWHNKSSIQTTEIFADLINPWSLFLTSDEDIYLNNDHSPKVVERWSFNYLEGERVSSQMWIFSKQSYDMFRLWLVVFIRYV
jgi:hypothetical protein